MADLSATEFQQLVSQVKEQILAQSQGVGEVEKVTSLSGVYSLPALRGNTVVEAPIDLLARPAEEAAIRADETVATAIGNVNDAIAYAEDTASHPTYIGEDNYVYVWNRAGKSYTKTSIYTRGEGFSISKTYSSIEEMENDKNHGLKEGDFVLINTNDVENPDNAKIYVVGSEGEFNFLVDMSGAIGFTGKTPQFEIGEVTVGVNKADTTAAIESAGTDADGNPKYKLNIKIPSIALADLTEEEIAELQSPANEMIEQLNETNEAVKAEELLRVEAEQERKESEESRSAAEILREESESERNLSETERRTSEGQRKSAESERSASEAIRNSNEVARVSAEDERVLSENSRERAESSRVSQESERVSAENERLEAEEERSINESGRETSERTREENEATRTSNENQRKIDENTRTANEQNRQSNEEARIKAERNRETEYASLKEDIQQATTNANDAAAESRNTPIIQNGTWWIWNALANSYVDTNTPATSRSPKIENGTWWVWDDDMGVYADTGQSVSADYVLTKANIEGVFTGNIQSHWHDRYVEKEEGKGLSDENFTLTEKQKLSTLENFDDTDINKRIDLIQDSIPTKVSQLDNDSGYITSHQDISHLATKEDVEKKQDIIEDLETIRSNAEKGANAINNIPSEYITESELESRNYVTTTTLENGLSTKQNLNTYITNITASNWVVDTTYEDFKYRCDLVIDGVTEDMYAEVVFSVVESVSGDYAPVCETRNNIVSIWSAKDETIILPTIIINK